MTTNWSFYGRSEQLGALLEHLRRSRWFFGTIRGRRRIGKTALIQQALETMNADSSNLGPWLLIEVPDSTPSDFATVFRSALEAAGLSNLIESPQPVTDLPGVAHAVSSLCGAGVTVVLDEFQVCRRGTLSGFPSLLKARVDRLQDRSPVGGLILLGSVQT
ncbi:MAG: ATP-binding protein [Gemmatimonadetes bacterium]|nr:ATP-binding protein [Gemmatimonadota bacterium]